jgi:hypothetical protein
VRKIDSWGVDSRVAAAQCGVAVVVLLAGNPTRLDGAAGLAALVWTPSIVL